MGSNNSRKDLKCFKIRTLDSDVRFGVVCKTLKDLLKKGCEKFQLPLSSTRVCLYEDGTELNNDEYLKTLPDNTVLVFLTAEQTWHGYITDIGHFLNELYKIKTNIVETAQKMLLGENAPEKQKMLADFIHNLKGNIVAETRDEDEQWFEGIESRFKDKSSYMRFSCASRVRSYVKEVQNHSDTVGPEARDEYKIITNTMCSALKAANYNGCYFDRTEQEANRLCNQDGWFKCQGAFDIDACASTHSINPYSNRESRIVFSTWNLDHRVEKKRTIIPRLEQAIRERKENQDINWEYFFNMLFTRENLKLVHIACHKKSAHNLDCDPSMIYRDRETPKAGKRKYEKHPQKKPKRNMKKQPPKLGKGHVKYSDTIF
ncbi:DNA fragmentation factor subunit beta [Rhinophrynus dorsalis]